MSLLMLKTKNLSWQDHTLNIEVMLAPLRSTLLLNKHKTLDTKFDQEKALYERQREACIKDFIVEKRLIERRRQKIMKRKRELMEARSKSALDDKVDTLPPATAPIQGRSSSAPSDSRGRTVHKEQDAAQPVPTYPGLPKLALRHTPLFGGSLLRPRIFLETGQTSIPSPQVPSDTDSSIKDPKSKRSSLSSAVNVFVTDSDRKSRKSSTPIIGRPGRKSLSKSPSGRGTDKSSHQQPPQQQQQHHPKPPLPEENARGIPRRIPNVKFLEFLDDDDEPEEQSNIVVEVKEKTVEEKVRDFLRELDEFNSRPPTACSSGFHDDSLISSRDSERRGPLVANKYTTFTLDKKLLEKAFDKYIENKSNEDLFKAMKLAAKMKAHIRQARNQSLMPTMATFKSTRSFMKLLKRQQRREKQDQGHPQ